MSTKGERTHQTFVNERVKNNIKSIWAPLQKLNLKLCKTNNKKMRIKIKDSVVELKEDVNLISRLLVASRARPDFDLKSVISKYELSAIPRSLYSSDGQMYHCLAKSKVMHLLEGLVDITEQEAMAASENSAKRPFKVAIIDAMAEVQMLDKPDHIVTCKELATYFFFKLRMKYSSFDEVHLIFDTYLEHSLKNWTRRKRQGEVSAVHYHITSDTNIRNTSLKNLLAHVKTKGELTAFFSREILRLAHNEHQHYIISWANNVKASSNTKIIDVSDLINDHEEADTKIILHGAFVARKSPSSHIHIFSPDTDVFILALSNYEKLTENTFFEIGHSDHRRKVHLKPIFNKLGPTKAAALPGYHSISGADITGSFYRKGKSAHWKAFEKADDEILEGLKNLGISEEISESTYKAIEKFVCKVYAPNTVITDIGELRWVMFSKKKISWENLPPTKDSLIPVIKRAHFQGMVWKRCCIAKQSIPSACNYGWTVKENDFSPEYGNLLSVPENVLELTACSCQKGRCRPPCKCLQNNIACSEICLCGGLEENCENMQKSEEYNGSDEELLDDDSDHEYTF